ncbi:hypothetical protein H5410_019288 [Solanum commersonii]|uniref:Uncharacterized protein n=1 Tax=Solanum commersonii TaxID=4109 RepID=A0A9J6A511_SOLCO|nr:hypothetical protein H5410_019288 [Solanum commersonii]
MAEKSYFGGNWLGNGKLKLLFPDLYDLSLQKGHALKEFWSPQGYYTLGGAKDNIILQNFGVKQGAARGEDTLRWQNCSSGIYTVSSAYKDLNRVESQITFW